MSDLVPIGPPKSREEAWARLEAGFKPFFKSVMDTTDSGLQQDEKVWRWTIDWVTGPFMKRLLYDEAKGPYCLTCEGQGETGEFDENHAFTPRDRTGAPPCLCGHLLENHSKGEKGENNPMYKYFEMFVRGKNPVPGMGPTPPMYDYKMLALFWQVMLDFEKFRGSATAFFGVKRPELPDGVPR